jgi:hypothetical protein
MRDFVADVAAAPLLFGQRICDDHNAAVEVKCGSGERTRLHLFEPLELGAVDELVGYAYRCADMLRQALDVERADARFGPCTRREAFSGPRSAVRCSRPDAGDHPGSVRLVCGVGSQVTVNRSSAGVSFLGVLWNQRSAVRSSPDSVPDTARKLGIVAQLIKQGPHHLGRPGLGPQGIVLEELVVCPVEVEGEPERLLGPGPLRCPSDRGNGFGRSRCGGDGALWAGNGARALCWAHGFSSWIRSS